MLLHHLAVVCVVKLLIYSNDTNHSEIVSTKPGQEGMKATLADCIYQTPCLKRLKFSESEAGKQFSEYLSMVRDWRNDNAHKAPTANEQECDTAINVLTSVYLYVVAFGIKKREIEQMEMAAKEIGTSDADISSVDNN